MRRLLIVLVAAGIVAVPVAGWAAASAPNLTLLSPTAETVTGGSVLVQWSYAGFHRSTPVDIEVRRDGAPFQRIGRVPIDDGTPGYRGSTRWTTVPGDDGADYTVRVIAPTNKRVSSSASPVTIDNTGPTTTIDATPPAEGVTPVSVMADITGSSADALGTVARVEVAFVDAAGGRTSRVPTCSGCRTPSATWRVSTAGLGLGTYQVQAWATDALGNVGAVATASFLVVGTPTPPEVTPPEVTPPTVEPPPVEPPPVEPPPIEPPPVEPPPVTVPDVTVPTVPTV